MKQYIKNSTLSNLYSRVHKERNYYNSAWKINTRKKLILELLSNLKNGSEILDLGCRDGALSVDLLSSFKITGIDIDSYAILQYKERLLKYNLSVDVFIADLNQTFPLEDMNFNAVIAGEIIEHLIDPYFFLQEIKRVLKSDGIFIGSTPNAARLDKRLKILMGKDPKEFSDPTHLQYFTKHTLETLLRKEFSDVKLYSYKNNNIIKIFPEIMADGFVFICHL